MRWGLAGFVFALLLVFSVPTVNAETLVYQENPDANTSSGSWTNFGNTLDGNWVTYGESAGSGSGYSYLYVNYTKTANSQGAIWEVKDNSAQTNLTIPSSCWNKHSGIIELRVESFQDPALTGSSTKWYCYNSSWIQLRGISSGGSNDDRVYEEAIWWNETEPIGITYIDSCQTLSAYNETYVLNATINYAGGSNCLTVDNDSISIDCAGHDIIDVGSGNIGIYYLSVKDGIVKNCDLHNWTRGIYFYYVNDSLIFNNTISMDESYENGIYLYASKNVAVEGVNFQGTDYDHALYSEYAETLSIKDVFSYKGDIKCLHCNNVYVNNVTSSDVGQWGFSLYDGENATIDLFSIYNSLEKGMFFQDFNNLSLKNIDVNTTGDVGIQFENDMTNILGDNIEISEVTYQSILIEDEINDSVFDHFYIYDSGTYGMYIANPQNLTLQNFVIRDVTNNDGINIYATHDSQDLLIRNATIENVNSRGMYISANTNRDNVEIYDVVINNAVSEGILFYKQNNVVVDNVNMTEVRRGFYADEYVTNGNFTNVRIATSSGSSRHGVYLYGSGSDNNYFENFTINLTGSTSGHGVSTSSSSDLTFINFDIYNADDNGFDIQLGTNLTIKDSEIYDVNRYGIYVFQVNNTYIENVFINNSASQGVYLRGYSIGSEVRNVNSTYNSYGFYARDIDNLKVQNLIALDNNNYGVYSYNTNYANITNAVSDNVTNYGFYFGGDNSYVSDVHINNSGIRGLYISGTENSVFQNILSENANLDDVYLSPSSESECNNLFINVNGTGNVPFLFYNSSITVQNRNNDYNAIELCNADNSNLENITSSNNKGHLRTYFSGNVTITNYQVDNGYAGIIMSGSGSEVSINGGIFRNVSSGLYNYGSNVLNAENVIIENVKYAVYDGQTGGYGIQVSNGNLTCENCSVKNSEWLCVFIRDYAGGITHATFNNSYFEGGNNTIYLDDSYGDSVVEFYNSNINGDIKSECSDYDPPDDVCAYDNTINLYDSNYSSHNITNSTLSIYWSLDVLNSLGADIEIYNVTDGLVSSFSDSRLVWLKEYEINPVNVRTNSTPHNVSLSKSGYLSKTVPLTMDMSRFYTVSMTSTYLPPSYTAQLITSPIVGLIPLLLVAGYLFFMYRVLTKSEAIELKDLILFGMGIVIFIIFVGIMISLI